MIDMGSSYLVAKSDPITFTAERLGWYAVNVNANDVATLGAQPKWFLARCCCPSAVPQRCSLALSSGTFTKPAGLLA